MLREKLIAKQQALGISDSAFAARLGVPRSTWQLTRTGVKAVGPRVARAAMAAFPEMTTDAVSFLLTNATLLTPNATEGKAAERVT